MTVIHILKDGSRIEDITGRVVKIEDAEVLYSMFRNINVEAEKFNKKNESFLG